MIILFISIIFTFYLVQVIQSISTTGKFDDDFNMTWWKGGSVKVMGNSYKDQGKCDFYAGNCLIELPEHYLVRNYIDKDSVVLEFGARYGTTSCEIANKVGGGGHVISIDPDDRSWNSFMINIKRHNCNVHFVKGVVGNVGVKLFTKKREYGTQTIETNDSTEQVGNVYTISQIEDFIGRKVDTLLIDCEGCINRVLSHLKNRMHEIKMIILEADMSVKELGRKSGINEIIDYSKIIYSLELFGFKVIRLLEDCDVNSLSEIINEYRIDVFYWNKHCIKNMDHYVLINQNTTLNRDIILKYQPSLLLSD